MPRAHGRIVDGAGNGVPGTCYFYRALDHEPTDWRAMVDASGRPVTGTVLGRPLAYTKVKADAVPGPDRRGFFDVPGGLPSGTYWIDFHPAGDPAQQRWAWPLVVTDGTVPMDVRIGGPSGGVPSGKPLVVVLFGDSDTSNPGPKVRTTSLDIELAGPSLTVINRAQGNLPVGTQAEPEGVWAGGPKRSGLDIVRKACAEVAVIDVAVLRYGLNDAHYYLSPPTPAGVAKFRDAYGKCIDALKAKGSQVLVCEICLEGGDRDRNADVAINDAIRDLAREKGCILISPHIDAEDDPKGYIDNSDQVHLTNAGTRYVAGLIRAKIAAPVVPPATDPTLTKQFTRGTYTASVSLYGLLGAPLDRAKRDLSRFRAAGFGNARVWIDWPEDRSPGCRALDENGNWIEDVAKRLDEYMLYGLSIGMSFDLTMRAAAYKAVKKSEEGYDISAHKRAVRNVLSRWGQQTAFRILDMANEAEVRGPGNHGSPDTGHVSPGRFKELMDVARSVPRKCLVSVSASEDGNPYHPDYDNGYLFRDTKGEILLPHFARVSGWGANEGPKGKALMALQPGIPCHCQEPARNNYHGQNWPVSEFEQSFRSAKANGLVGMCFHTGAGFDMTQRDAWDQLDSVEQQVVANLKGWIS